MKNYKLGRRDVIAEARDRCMEELYEKAQPSADINVYIDKIKSGEITKEEQDKNPIYNRHYLSREELKYIVDKYHYAYRLNDEFKEDCNILLRDMKDGYSVDKYIKEHTDETGHHPGYRGYEHKPGIEKQVEKELKKSLSEEEAKKLAKKMTNIFKKFIENRRDFYRFDRDGEIFDYNVYLGACPSSSKEKVIEYWKSQGVDIEIKDRNPEYFWCHDNGYTDEDIREEYELPEDAPVD